MRNKLIPVLLLGLILVVGFVIVTLSNRDEAALTQHVDVEPPKPEGLTPAEAVEDNYVETLETIASRTSTIESRQETIKQETLEELAAQLTAQFAAKEAELEHVITSQVERRMAALGESPQVTGDTNALGIPTGLGFDGLPIGRAKSIDEDTPRDDVYVTVQPVAEPLVYDSKGNRVENTGTTFGRLLNPVAGTTPSKPLLNPTNNISQKDDNKPPPPEPRYTIPVTSTLFSNKAMTALMGVVPRAGKVKDPIRFKVITGGENLATNGLHIPDVANIVWSGIAIGNRELGCVRGNLYAVTFTFQDGTISTYKRPPAGPSKEREPLAYISDKWGKPCIKGTLVSNSTQYLRDRLIVAGTSSAAAAAAATETTQITSTQGGATSVASAVTGDTSDFIVSRTTTGTLNELAAYLAERQADAIDIVYTDPGIELVVHVETQVDIDYDPVGRKLVHAVIEGEQTHGFD